MDGLHKCWLVGVKCERSKQLEWGAACRSEILVDPKSTSEIIFVTNSNPINSWWAGKLDNYDTINEFLALVYNSNIVFYASIGLLLLLYYIILLLAVYGIGIVLHAKSQYCPSLLHTKQNDIILLLTFSQWKL